MRVKLQLVICNDEGHNWLRVLDTAESSQVDQRVGHQLHAIMPLLDVFKTEQQPLEFVFPRKGPLHTHAQCMNHGIEQALPSTLGGLTIARILFDVRNQPCIENAVPIACGIKAAIEVEIGPTEIYTDLFRHLFQCL